MMKKSIFMLLCVFIFFTQAFGSESNLPSEEGRQDAAESRKSKKQQAAERKAALEAQQKELEAAKDAQLAKQKAQEEERVRIKEEQRQAILKYEAELKAAAEKGKSEKKTKEETPKTEPEKTTGKNIEIKAEKKPEIQNPAEQKNGVSEKFETTVNLPVKYEKTLEIAIINACKSAGWRAEKNETMRKITAVFNSHEKLDTSIKLDFIYNQQGYKIVYDYHPSPLVSVSEMRKKYNEWVAFLNQKIRDNIDFATLETAMERKDARKSIGFNFQTNDKGIIKNAVVRNLEKYGWTYNISDENMIETGLATRKYAYHDIIIEILSKGYKISYPGKSGISGGESDAFLGNLEVYITELANGINEDIYSNSTSPEIFTGSAGWHQTSKSFADIIKFGCKESGWSAVEEKTNEIIAVYKDEEGRSATVKITFWAEETASEYKIVYNEAINLDYNYRKNQIDSLYNKWVYSLYKNINSVIRRSLKK